MTARDVLALKVGDVVRMNPVGRADRSTCAWLKPPRFHGRPGTVAGKWAVELTRRLKD